MKRFFHFATLFGSRAAHLAFLRSGLSALSRSRGKLTGNKLCIVLHESILCCLY